jgi:RsiW-degrading membrane proteinase PrsW (M82 family)
MQKDKAVIQLHKPDASEMVFFFLCGVVISVPLTLFIYQYADTLLVGLDPFTATLIARTIFAPFVEEFTKAYPLFYRHGETERSIFNIALSVGMGFAIVELATYVSAVGAPVTDRLPGLFFHPASTSITAYGIATKRPLPYYLVAVFFHFSYNYLVLASSFGFLIALFVMAMTVFTSWQLRSRTKEKIVI